MEDHRRRSEESARRNLNLGANPMHLLPTVFLLLQGFQILVTEILKIYCSQRKKEHLAQVYDRSLV